MTAEIDEWKSEIKGKEALFATDFDSMMRTPT
jgi:hypothetical protein